MKRIVLVILIGISLILSGCSTGLSIKPTSDISAKFRQFHNGYAGKNLIGESRCAGVFPQAILDTQVQGIISKEKIQSIYWNGGCHNGLMHGKGIIEVYPKAGSNIISVYLIGVMQHGFFSGRVDYKHRLVSGKAYNHKLYVKLNTRSDYIRYETPKAYNKKSSKDDSSMASLLAAAAVVAGITYIAKGISNSSSGSSYSSYSNSSESKGYECSYFCRTSGVTYYSSERYNQRINANGQVQALDIIRQVGKKHCKSIYSQKGHEWMWVDGEKCQ